MQWTETIWTTLKEDKPRIIPVKFGQNPISGLGVMLFKDCERTDGQTDDDDEDDGRWVITIAHLEPSAQVS